MLKISVLNEIIEFPDVNTALKEPNGLLAIGGDLSSERLLLAYKSGIFPWFNHGEIIQWWSPDPRMLMQVHDLKISRSLAQVLRRDNYQIRQNSNFSQVIENCAKVKRFYTDGTWIVNSMVQAYEKLHQLGYAHSIEVWRDETMVGGLYGVMIGGYFCGESMFHFERDTSKIAFCYLVKKLQNAGIKWLDCQMPTEHLASLGAKPVPREQFISMLTQQIQLKLNSNFWQCTDLAKTDLFNL